jgi:predicted phosphohydrolase
MHLLMGNHDYFTNTEAGFEQFFAEHASASHFVAEQNTVALLPGVTAIKLNAPANPEADKMDYTSCYGFLAEVLEEAATARPDDAILIMAHEPPEHMSLPLSLECGYYGQGSDLDLVELIARYPQARMFSGHLHNPLDIPEAVNNDLGFTSVHTSAVGSCFFVRNQQVDYEQNGSHGLVLDVMEDGSLLLHRINFTDVQYFGEPVAI